MWDEPFLAEKGFQKEDSTRMVVKYSVELGLKAGIEHGREGGAWWDSHPDKVASLNDGLGFLFLESEVAESFFDPIPLRERFAGDGTGPALPIRLANPQ